MKKALFLTLISASALTCISPNALAKKTTTHKKKASAPKFCKHRPRSFFQIGPYLYSQIKYNGSELIVNVPKIREAARLMQVDADMQQFCGHYDLNPLPVPSLTFSGMLEGQAFISKKGTTKQSAINYDASEIDAYLRATNWLNAFASVEYSHAPSSPYRIHFGRGFISAGNLSKSPFYATAGQVYAPFGRYASSMITSPMTLNIGRSLIRSAVFGYQQQAHNPLHVEVYAFNGVTYLSAPDHQNGFGVDAGYTYHFKKISGTIGASYISNLASSEGIQSVSNFNNQEQNVNAIDFYGSMIIGNFTTVAEFVDALKGFQGQYLIVNRNQAPRAFNVEESYGFSLFNKPSSVAIGYGLTGQADSFQIPRQDIAAVFNTSLIKSTVASLEYRHDYNYATASAKTGDTVTFQFDVYF